MAQEDISIRIMLCMDINMVIGTIGKAEVNFMGVILGRGGRFVNGGFRFHALGNEKEE